MDFTGLNNGDSWIAAGGTGIEHVGHVDISIGVSNGDGLPTGGGCWEKYWTGVNSADGPFDHENITIPGGTDACTVFKHVKLITVSGGPGTVSGCQYKSTRLCPITGGASAYAATPSLRASYWTDGSSPYGFVYGLYDPGTGEVQTPSLGSIAHFDAYDGNWHSTFYQGQLNTIGNSDGFQREWWYGAYRSQGTGLSYRSSGGTLINSVQHNPGEANNFGSTGDWYARHARIVVIKGLAWCAFGNNSTFSTTTDLLVVEPTSWSNTSIHFNTHGTIPSGYNWMYVMDTSGNVNSSGLTTFS